MGNFIGNKRKRDNESEHTLKRITTAKYIYQTLYEEGKNSDLTVKALGHEFHLHRIYLCQSPYFASMLGGAWLESDQKYIVIHIIDPQITIASLKTVFGSLYNDEITLNPVEIIPILASATMFQLDKIIDKCTEVMIKTINPKSAMTYYNAACQYAAKKLQEMCMQWFLVNLMTFYYGSLCYLRTIPISLMTKLVANPNLFVVETEISLCHMLKLWMYIHVHKDLHTTPSIEEINAFYSANSDGENFKLAFQGLRIQDSAIMPNRNQNKDEGPFSEIVDEVFFLSRSVRYGRILNENDRRMWHWTCFYYPMDLLMVIDGPSLSIEQDLCCQIVIRLAIRVTVVTLNEQRQILFQQRTGIKNVSLKKMEKTPLMVFDKDITFPLIISANILFISADRIVNQDAVTPTTQ